MNLKTPSKFRTVIKDHTPAMKDGECRAIIWMQPTMFLTGRQLNDIFGRSKSTAKNVIIVCMGNLQNICSRNIPAHDCPWVFDFWTPNDHPDRKVTRSCDPFCELCISPAVHWY